MFKVYSPAGKLLISRPGGAVLSAKFIAKNPTVRVWARISKAAPGYPVPSCTTQLINLGSYRR